MCHGAVVTGNKNSGKRGVRRDAGRHAAPRDPGSAYDPGSASFGDDHLEIFAGDHQRAIPGDVELVEQSKQVGIELDFVDQLKLAAIAILDGLRRLAPAPVQDGVGRGDPCRAVASFERMMPTRTLSAVRVWLRASDRISVSDFGIQVASETESESGSSSRAYSQGDVSA